ncbi:UNVERIFIED_CONTAM: hypothetical protein FKN15_070906 [Acipenser sinensis]
MHSISAAGSLLVKRSTLSPACPVGHFPCGNLSMCLPQLQHCNGVQDCSNGADELNCEDLSGWSGMFRVKGIPDPQGWHQECFLSEYPRVCDCQETELECVDVNLDSVPRVSSNVTLLILDDNPIKIIPSQMFMGLKSLFFMFLRQNEISVISENTFSSLRNLIELDLSGNKLHRLPANIFQDLRSLETLNLSGNNLSHIHPSQFDSLACVRSL